MARRQKFVIDHDPAPWTVKLDYPYPLGIRRKGVGAFNKRRIDRSRVPVIDQAAYLIAFVGGVKFVAAPVTTPKLSVKVDIQIL